MMENNLGHFSSDGEVQKIIWLTFLASFFQNLEQREKVLVSAGCDLDRSPDKISVCNFSVRY